MTERISQFLNQDIAYIVISGVRKGVESEYSKVTVKPFESKDGVRYQLEYTKGKQVVHQNIEKSALAESIAVLFETFTQCVIYGAENDFHLNCFNGKIKAKTMFSTHYHELTILEKDLKHLKNVHVSAVEEDGKITFLHKVKVGAVDKSYGIHVASLAKLPDSLIKRANDVLSVYEKKNIKKETFTQTSLFELTESESEPKINQIEAKVKEINPLEMTPMEALSFLYELNKEAKGKK